MNMKKNILSFGTLLLFSAILWSCSDNSDGNLEDDMTLDQLIEVKANALSDAVVEISKSKGFELITMIEEESSVKTGEDEDSRPIMDIDLEDIQGVYDYVKGMNQESTSVKTWAPNRFVKVDESDYFVLRMPKEKAMKPWKLFKESDEEIVNDFVITTTEYEYAFSGSGFEYLLNSKIEVEEEEAGELHVEWSLANEMPIEYASKFTFADEHSVGVEFILGDKISYEFSIKKGDDVLFQEEVEVRGSEEEDDVELEYSIEIGNIKIVFNSETEDYKIYRNGELQEGATIQVVKRNQNSDDGEFAFCRKGRDIKITFADETSIELSEFITDETLDLMDKLFSSMHDMKFVKHIVDKIAFKVYFANQF